MLRFGLVFFAMFLSIATNLSDGMLARMGFDPDILMATTIAFVVTGLIHHRRLALICLVLGLTIGANVPPPVADSLGYDPNYMVAALLAVVFSPYLYNYFSD